MYDYNQSYIIQSLHTQYDHQNTLQTITTNVQYDHNTMTINKSIAKQDDWNATHI